jgi:uncharacterized membrane protein YbhN (UPF0104 family)
MGATQPSINSLISRRAGAETQGEVMGVAQSTGSLSRVLGPIIAGALFAEFGRNSPFLWGAVLVAAALAERGVRRISVGARDRHGLVERLREQARDSWLRIHELLRADAPRLLIASAGYIAAQVALLDVSLHTVGLHPPLTVVIMAAAIERLGTLLPITPGGTGVAELGAIAWLIGTGLPSVEVVAGVLLCRIFLVVMEIPVGSALLAGWMWSQRSARTAGSGMAA